MCQPTWHSGAFWAFGFDPLKGRMCGPCRSIFCEGREIGPCTLVCALERLQAVRRDRRVLRGRSALPRYAFGERGRSFGCPLARIRPRTQGADRVTSDGPGGHRRFLLFDPELSSQSARHPSEGRPGLLSYSPCAALRLLLAYPSVRLHLPRSVQRSYCRSRATVLQIRRSPICPKSTDLLRPRPDPAG
jgi:hypothetical protein